MPAVPGGCQRSNAGTLINEVACCYSWDDYTAVERTHIMATVEIRTVLFKCFPVKIIHSAAAKKTVNTPYKKVSKTRARN